ncbi:collectin-10 isoform X2 [Phyllopteryx taeniolatus]|uniref:collectin-10 isoform X2 n=1 Tax=Phyllopteryx taeniolatus TaxID=161469 RepID=UPI002AD2B8BA|nr:collectin-10 isoform X2 [Phyllopteryx taeniolatus]
MARHSSGLFLFCAAAAFAYVSSSAEVCSHSLIPGAKGDQGEIGNEGDEGRIGKNGPPGHPGASGEAGMKGDNGHMGKTGPSGDQGDKGATGLDGPSGLKGKAGTTCDCGKYRRVVGQMDVNVGKLRNGVKFVKNIMLGLTESEERYYLLVKEAKSYKEASMNCKLRGGTLAVPNTVDSNRLMADYVSQSGLTRVYVGLLPNNTDTLSHNGRNSSRDADSSPLPDFVAWSQDEELTSPSHNASCVELLSTGTWNHVECDTAMFFICEFPKGRITG